MVTLNAEFDRRELLALPGRRQARHSVLFGSARDGDRVDTLLRRTLFDPSAADALVLARRPEPGSVVQDVVSDLVWQEVVRLLRWASATTRAGTPVPPGIYWRLAAGCAHLLRLLPGLSSEIDEAWRPAASTGVASQVRGAERIQQVAGRLAGLLRAGGPVPLSRLSADVDDLGSAAIQAIADGWHAPLDGSGPVAAGRF